MTMLSVISLTLLALAVSLDGFGAGVTYGLRKIRIPWSSVAIIAGCSGLVFLLSMEIGQWLARWLAPGLAKSLGAVILILIGIWAIWQMRSSKEEEPENGTREAGEACLFPGSSHRDALRSPSVSTAADASPAAPARPPAERERTILRIELKRLGIVIQMLKKPQLADLDRSGNISATEALVLGTALSLDAFGAGIGAAFVGFAPVLTAAVVALSGGVFISAGVRIGRMYAETSWLGKLSFVPGCILIVMGILKLM